MIRFSPFNLYSLKAENALINNMIPIVKYTNVGIGTGSPDAYECKPDK